MTPAAISQPFVQRSLQSLIALTLAFLALAASGTAWANDPSGRVGRVATIDGNVWLFDDDQGEWVQARRNRPVTEGDRLSAEQGGRAEVQIGAATLRLDGGTDVEFTQMDDARVRIRVHGGSVALRVRGGESVREFAVVTNEGRYEPLRPGHYRVDVREQSSLGETLAGSMRFEARDSVLDLNDGQRAEFWQERGTTHYAWGTPLSDRFADWVAREDREDTRDRNRYVSPEMTGAEDLDRHGRWDRHPEYGTVWYPTVVAAGWAPYRYGQWVHTRRYGWTWVDDAPWGFAPFHYGRWVNYGGRWGWCPGQYVARPVYSPALVAWFGGPNISVGINIGGPAVGWVPLSPREIYYPHYQVSNVYVRNINHTHGRWHGPNPRYERTVPTGPIMYTNQGVAGGVTVVPQGVMHGRQPISSQVALPVDARTVARWQAEAPRGVVQGALGSQQQRAQVAAYVPPAPPTSRVVAAPGGAALAAVPAAPGAVRPTPWAGAGGRAIGAAQGDGGQAPRGDRAPAAEQRPAVVGRPVAPPATVQPPQQPVQQAAPPVAAPPQGVPAVQAPPPAQRGVVPAPQPPGQRDLRDARREREERIDRLDRGERIDRGDRVERRVAPPVALPQAVPQAAPPRPAFAQPAQPAPQIPQMPQMQRPAAPAPAVVQPPQQPQGNAGQARERERAQERNDDRRAEIPRRVRDPRDQQAR